VAERISRLEEKVSGLEERVARVNDELKELSLQVSNLHVKLDMLINQYDRNYNLLRWIIYILLGMVGLIVGFKVVPPP